MGFHVASCEARRHNPDFLVDVCAVPHTRIAALFSRPQPPKIPVTGIMGSCGRGHANRDGISRCVSRGACARARRAGFRVLFGPTKQNNKRDRLTGRGAAVRPEALGAPCRRSVARARRSAAAGKGGSQAPFVLPVANNRLLLRRNKECQVFEPTCMLRFGKRQLPYALLMFGLVRPGRRHMGS